MNAIAPPSKLFDVAGKTALITGASGALGRAAALGLAGAGAKVVLAAGNAKELAALESEIAAIGGKSVSIAKRPESLADAEVMVAKAVEAFGGLDILVASSGTNDPSPIVDMSVERWEAVMDANVKGSWLVCKAAGAQFLKQGKGGKVVLISSTRGKLGHPAGYTAYCASKAAIDGTVRALACEWGKHKINVNGIGPTVFRSKLTAWMFADDPKGTAVREGMLSRIPLGRLGEPEDLIGTVLFLSSAASDFCTGQVMYIDGGYTAG
ncbi:MAG TPA: SDR family oxidoreductase [Magnetospirillaceae bacterium]|jgi:NAD(P)-dependent dehydrogenase (short-subunit alcohol dehydrogenase family)